MIRDVALATSQSLAAWALIAFTLKNHDIRWHRHQLKLRFWGATKSAPLKWDLAQRNGWYKVPSLCDPR